jgi:hypothetical protein
MHVLRLVPVLLFAACAAPQSEGPPVSPDAGINSCGGQYGLGKAEVSGGYQFTNAWAFHPPSVQGWGWETTGDPAALEVMMSTDSSLTCSTVSEVSLGQVQAFVLTMIPPGNDAVAPGSYAIAATANPGSAAVGAMIEFECSGGQGNSCLEEPAGSGTIHIDTVDSPVIGQFSLTLPDDGGEDEVTGSFCAPICSVSG